MEKIDIDNIRQLKDKVGAAKTKWILEVVGKEAPLMEALQTDVGKEILKSSLEQLVSIQEKMINETDTPADRAEYRVLRRILGNWAGKIEKYYRGLDMIKRG